jgi:cytidine deaminase
MDVADEQLIEAAAKALNSQALDDFYVADVGCALVSASGHMYTGACIGGYVGICAEQSAVGQLVSKERPTIKKLVVVWRDDAGRLHALAPCGRCRQFLLSVSVDNLETQIILGDDHVATLRDLLPLPSWHAEPL